ncbi:MAG: hypothetical protein NVV82_26475 [Sporocytophaga sp.]|nr:hypothetical protein [Sporocytophaga sp.]
MAYKHKFFLLIASFLLSYFCYGQKETSSTLPGTGQMEEIELAPKNVHPKAKKLLKESFYWSSIDPTGPLGSDEGSDAFYGFRQWRLTNKSTSPLSYLDELIRSWDFPKFDLNELDTVKIKEYITAKSNTNSEIFNNTVLMEQFRQIAKDSGSEFSEEQFKELITTISGGMGETFLTGIDNAIIGVGFGQFVLEGKIDEDIKALTQTAIKRELLPILLEKWTNEYQASRVNQLNQMLKVLDKMNL